MTRAWRSSGRTSRLCDNLDAVANLFLGQERRRVLLATRRCTTSAPELLRRLAHRRARPVATGRCAVERPTAVRSRSPSAWSSLAQVLLLDEPTAPLGVAKSRLVDGLLRAARVRDGVAPREPPPTRCSTSPIASSCCGTAGSSPTCRPTSAPRRRDHVDVRRRDGLDRPQAAPPPAQPGGPAVADVTPAASLFHSSSPPSPPPGPPPCACTCSSRIPAAVRSWYAPAAVGLAPPFLHHRQHVPPDEAGGPRSGRRPR